MPEPVEKGWLKWFNAYVMERDLPDDVKDTLATGMVYADRYCDIREALGIVKP